jgi:hypothetical protein
MNPDRAGQEIWMPHEDTDSNGNVGADFRDALTGSVLWSVPATVDVGEAWPSISTPITGALNAGVPPTT